MERNTCACKIFLRAFVLFLLFVSCSLGDNLAERQKGNDAASMKAVTGKFLGNIFPGTSEPTKFLQYWNQVTPENAGKWGEVERSRDQMSWSTHDAIYNYTRQKGIPLKFHTLIWGQQQPSWITSLSTAEQLEEIEEWFSNVAARYPNLELIDVVNEPLHAPPDYRNALGGDGSTGWDWVVKSFQLARKYFPNSILLVNDYGIISDPGAAARYTNLIMILKSRNLVDGIGIQCHYFNMNTVTTNTMKQVLGMLAATGLPIYVSELDMQGDDQTQFQRYREKFPILWEHPSVKGITLWGYIEGQMWASDAYLLRSDGTERPALTWLMQYVKGSSSSSSSSIVSSSSSSVVSSSSSVSSRSSSSVSSSSISSSSSVVSSSVSSSSSVVSSSSSSVSSSSSSTGVTYVTITLPFSYDGAGEFYWKTDKFSTVVNWSRFINSWNVDILEINGVNYANKWVAEHTIPPASDGFWYIRYKGSFPWSHFEAK